MLFFLFDGEIHEIEMKAMEEYRRLKFEQQVFAIPVKNMELKRSNSEHRGDREKSAGMMLQDIERNRNAMGDRAARICSLAVRDCNMVFAGGWDLAGEPAERKRPLQGFFRGKSGARIRALSQQITNELTVIARYEKSNRALLVEIHKKYSIPVACLVFVLIGAPIGIMARQGGLAVGIVLSMTFFLIYWAFLIGGEQLADRGFLDPRLAMWLPNVIVGLGGGYLMIRMVKEISTVQRDDWIARVKNLGRKKR